MSDTPPVIGQDPWGTDLNAYLASLEARVVAVEGRAEMVYNSTSYRFDPGAPPATGTPPGQLRLDNVNASLATLIDLRLLDSDGADRSLWLRVLDAGCKIRITDWNDASIHHSYDVTGPATLDATNASIPVAWTTGLGTIPAGTINVGFLTALEVF